MLAQKIDWGYIFVTDCRYLIDIMQMLWLAICSQMLIDAWLNKEYEREQEEQVE